MGGRRSAIDEKWQQTCREVDIRDKGVCRCLSILLPSEYEQLKTLNPPQWMLERLDHAHIFPVSLHLQKTYEKNNVVLLCRWCHTHIDNLLNPLTNESMSKNEQWYWWVRIKFKLSDLKYDDKIDYEDLYIEYTINPPQKQKKNVFDWW